MTERSIGDLASEIVDGIERKRPKPNRHIIDRFADLTQEIKRLTEERDALKETILANMSEPPAEGETRHVNGDDYTASVSLVTSERMDRKAVEKLLSKPKFAACLKSSTAVVVRVSERRRLAVYGDSANFEWKHGESVTFPARGEQP